MARARRRQAMPWERAATLLRGFDRGHQEERLRDLAAALSAARCALGDAQQRVHATAAGCDEKLERELLDVADACKTAAARMGPTVRLVSAVCAAIGFALGRKPAVPWPQAQQRLRDFDRQEHEAKLRRRDEGLAAARSSHTRAADKVDAAHRAFDKIDLLNVVEAGQAAAERAQEYETVTQLVGRITAADCLPGNASDARYKDFRRLLNGEYQQLALEDHYREEAHDFATLEAVLDRMASVRLAPRIASRNLCAVAGGFSSGKSSFINALIGDDLLPTHITPTTSIPTFIFNIKDAGQRITLFNHTGGGVEIEPETLQQMTHDFHRIELRRLVERVSIYTPKLEAWRNVALIDTPGYTNPDGAERTFSDEAVALRSIWRSRYLIWLVDCERGTLPDQDVGLIKGFLQQRAPTDGEAVYLVLNKADKKPPSVREAILNQVVETCSKHDIPYFGVALYSAHKDDWYGCVGQSFDDFLKAVDGAEAVTIEALEDDVEAVFARYAKHHTDEQKRLTAALGLMNRLSLALEDDQPNLVRSLKEHQGALKKAIDDDKRWAQRAVALRGKFLYAVRGFITEVEAMRDVL